MAAYSNRALGVPVGSLAGRRAGRSEDVTTEEAFRLSKEMMDGEKWETFVLDLSFIGWHLLGACTFGILTILYVNPYQYYTEAELYHVLRDRM